MRFPSTHSMRTTVKGGEPGTRVAVRPICQHQAVESTSAKPQWNRLLAAAVTCRSGGRPATGANVGVEVDAHHATWVESRPQTELADTANDTNP